jgi:hypothetical protein
MKFNHVLGSVTETAVRGLGNLMCSPPPEDVYTQLQPRLLAAHTLTKFQRMEKPIDLQARWPEAVRHDA